MVETTSGFGENSGLGVLVAQSVAQRMQSVSRCAAGCRCMTGLCKVKKNAHVFAKLRVFMYFDSNTGRFRFYYFTVPTLII